MHSRSEHLDRKMISRKKSLARCATSLPTWANGSMCGRHQKSTILVGWREWHPVHGRRSRRATQIGYFHHRVRHQSCYRRPCFEVVCEHVQKDLRGTENEFTLGSRKLRHGQQPRSDIQTFANTRGLGQNSLTKCSWHSCELVDM